jgi:glutathione S-transferase
MTSRKLYRFALSGHSHRAQLFLALLQLDVDLVDVNLPGKEHKEPHFLEKNPFGQVPVLVDEDVVVADSNAILTYLAARYGGSRWLPEDPFQLSQIVRWFAVTSGPVTQSLALGRAHFLFKAPADLASVHAKGRELLGLYERELAKKPFLIGSEPSLADIANYTYVAHCPEGGFSLEPFSGVRAWLERIEALPGFIGMKKSPPPGSV